MTADRTAERKGTGRADKMRSRMADPAFKAKALANLERGRAARAAKRNGDSQTTAGERLAAKAPAAKPADRTADDSPATTARRAFGPGRWRS